VQVENYQQEITKRKLWSCSRALGSRLKGRWFDPNARWKWFQSHARIDSCTQSWFIKELKKNENTGSQMGHTKKIF